MSNDLTVAELEKRWDKALTATHRAVNRHPGVYRSLKSLAVDIVENPLDIREYLPTVEKLMGLLDTLDPNCQGSIFNLFNDRVKPADICQVPLLRVDCRDLLDHLDAFDHWRMENCRLKIVK